MPLKLVRSPNTGRYYPVNIAGELPTDEEKTRIKDYISQRDRSVPSIDSDIDQEKPRSGFFGAIDVGEDYLRSNLFSALQGVGEATGLEGMADYFGDKAEKVKEEAAQKSEGLTRFSDVSLGKTPKFIGETIGQALPQIGTALGVGALTALAAPVVGVTAAVGATIGALATNLPLLMGANRERQKEVDISEGRPVEVDEGAAFITAIPQALMETIGLKFITKVAQVGGHFNPIKFETAGIFTKLSKAKPKTAGGLRITGAAASGATVEGVTEIGQQLLERYQAGLDIGGDDAIEEYIEAAVAGGIVGGAIRGTVATGQQTFGSNEKVKGSAELDEDIEAQKVENDAAKANERKSYNQDPLKIAAQQEEPVTSSFDLERPPSPEGLEQLAEKPVTVDNLTEEQLQKIRRWRADQKNEKGEPIYIEGRDPDTGKIIFKDIPITLREVRLALGNPAVEKIAAKQGLNVDRTEIPLQPVRKYSYDQYQNIVNKINKAGRKKFSEMDMDYLIEGVVKNSSSELISSVRDDLVKNGTIRATVDNAYYFDTKQVKPISETKFKKEQRFTVGRDANRANLLERNISKNEADLKKTRERLGNSKSKLASLEQLKKTPIYIRKEDGSIVNNIKRFNEVLGTNFRTPAKTASPEAVNRTKAAISAILNNQLGKKKDVGQSPTKIRKTVDDLETRIDRVEGSLKAARDEIEAMETSDPLVDNTRRGRAGGDANNPERLFFARRAKKGDLENQKKKSTRLRREKKQIERVQETPEDDNKLRAKITELDASIQEEQKLDVDIKALTDRLDDAHANVQFNHEKHEGNNIKGNSRLAPEKPFSVKYRSNMNKVINQLRKYLIKELKLKPEMVELVSQNVINADESRSITFGFEKRVGDNKSMITLATELYDADTFNSKEGLRKVYKRLKGVLNHEVMHSLRTLGLLTDKEFENLVDATKTRKVSIWREGKLVERKYTHFDKAKRMNPIETFSSKPESKMTDAEKQQYKDYVEEEAVAEMFRDYMDNKMKIGGRPQNLFNRILKFFRSLFMAHNDNGLETVEDIFDGIKTGKIGGTRKARENAREVRKRYSKFLTAKVTKTPKEDLLKAPDGSEFELESTSYQFGDKADFIVSPRGETVGGKEFKSKFGTLNGMAIMERDIKDPTPEGVDLDLEAKLPIGVASVPKNKPSPKYEGKDLFSIIKIAEKDGYKIDPITEKFLFLDKFKFSPTQSVLRKSKLKAKELEKVYKVEPGYFTPEEVMANVFFGSIDSIIRQDLNDRLVNVADYGVTGKNLDIIKTIQEDLYNLTQAQLEHLPDIIPVWRIGPVDDKGLYQGVAHNYALNADANLLATFYGRPEGDVVKDFVAKRGVEPELLPYFVDKRDIMIAPQMGKGDFFTNDTEQDVIIRPEKIIRDDIDKYEYIYGETPLKLRRAIGLLSDSEYKASALPEVDLNTLKFVNSLPIENGQPERRKAEEIIRAYTNARMERSGEDFRVDYRLDRPEDLERVARIMAAEAELALARDGNAIGWYDAKLSLAKKLFSIVEPKIASDPKHEAAFDFALAVTSNGVAVLDNASHALRAYRSWKDTGKFEVIGYNERQAAMEKAFKFYNIMKDNLGDEVKIAKFLDEKVTIKELKNSTFLKEMDEKYDLDIAENLGSENVDTVVTKSIIFGPKIGNGFYQNIRGNYDTITMDMWWQRFFNRITGSPFRTSQDKTKINNYNRFVNALKAPKSQLTAVDRDSLRTAIQEVGKPAFRNQKNKLDQNIIDLAKAFHEERNRRYIRISMEGARNLKGEERRAKVAENRVRAGIDRSSDLSRESSNMINNFFGPILEMPDSGGHRNYMRRASKKAIEILEKTKVIDKGQLTTADFQALMWFHEKSLFKALGVREGRGGEHDYVDGAIDVLRKEGIDEVDIEEALPTTDRFRITGGTDPRSGNEQAVQRASVTRDKIAKFKPQEEKNRDIQEQQQGIIDERNARRADPEVRRSVGLLSERGMKEDRIEGSIREDIQAHQHKMMYTASANAIANRLMGKVPKFIPVFGNKKIPFVGFDDEKATKLADAFVRVFQDRMIPVSRMVDLLQERGFKLSDVLDPVLQEQIMKGATGAKIEDRHEGIYKEIIESVKKLNFSDAEINELKRVSRDASDPDQTGFLTNFLDDFSPSFWKKLLYGKQNKQLGMAEAYLYALHARERNRYVRSIDVNGVNKYPNRGSGMSDAEADAILAWFRTKESSLELLNSIRNQARVIVDDTNKIRTDAGLQKLYGRGSGWTEYVPLKGVFHSEDETVDYSNRGSFKKPLYGASGKEDLRVKGRMDYSPNILANLLTQNSNSLIRGDRNRIGVIMLNMIREDPEMLREFAVIEDITPDKVMLDARTGTLSKRKITAAERMEDKRVLVVKDKGSEVVIRFNDERIAGAFRGDTTMSFGENADFFLRKIGLFNRFLSNINTTYNPAFVLPNFVRDLETALINVDQYEAENLKRTVLSKALPMSRGIFRAISKTDLLLRAKTLDDSTPEARSYLEFVKYGGKNVTNQMTTLEDQVRDLGGILNNISEAGLVGKAKGMYDGFAGGKVKSLVSLVENTNTAAENGIRVATYQTLLDTGKYSPQQAALAARNITVNFAKGGEAKPIMNSLYLFYNASLQGSFALLQAFSKSSKVRKMYMGLFFSSFILDQLNYVFSDEDDEGNKEYDKLTDFMLEHNVIVPNLGVNIAQGITGEDIENKTFGTIPLPYGVNMVWNAGRALSRRMRGGYTAAQATSSITATTLEAVNPLGGAESFYNFVMPTAVDPFISLGQNIDYDKTPIYKEVSQFAVGTPDSQAYWNSASPTAVTVAQFMNKFGVFGFGAGSDVRGGIFDVSPDKLDFIFGYLTGGAGTFVRRTAELGFNIGSGQAFEAFEEGLSGQEARDFIRTVPLLRRAIYSTSEREDTGKFIQKRNEVFIARKELKAAVESGDQFEVQRVRERYPEELKIYGIIRAINSKRQKLTSARNKLLRDDELEESDKEMRLERLDKAIQKLINRGNQLMKNVKLGYLSEIGVTD